MRDHDFLDEWMDDVDPARDAPPVSPRPDDARVRQIMAMGDRLDWGTVDAPAPSHRRALVVGWAVAGVAAALLVVAVIWRPGLSIGSGGVPLASSGVRPSFPVASGSWGGSGGPDGPGGAGATGGGSRLQLILPANAPAPLTGCAGAWAAWPSPGDMTIAPSGGSVDVGSAGAISVAMDVGLGYAVDVPDDHTVVLHGPGGAVAATFVDLGPAVRQVQVRDASGRLLGTVDYGTGDSGVNIHVTASYVSVGAWWTSAQPSVAPGGGPATTSIKLEWSPASGVVLPSPLPDATSSLAPPPVQTGPEGVATPQASPALAPMGLVLATPVGDTVLGLFSSTAGTVVCAATTGASGQVGYTFGYQSDYFDAQMAVAAPDTVYALGSSAPGGWEGLSLGGHGFIAGGMGSDVVGLVVNLSDQTQASAQLSAPYWMVVYPGTTSDGRPVVPMSVTATLRDGRTVTVGWG